ncbi:MAG TPA: hypothetical protein VF476_08825 [Chitinophagaceae bacterium]
MKKFLLLTLIFSAIIATSHAQTGNGPSASLPPQTKEAAPDPATMLQQMKDKLRPQMVEKTGFTAAMADKIIEINFEMRQAAGALRDLSDADRSKKIAELKAEKDKKLAALLTPEQLNSLKAFYEELAKNAQPKPGN